MKNNNADAREEFFRRVKKPLDSESLKEALSSSMTTLKKPFSIVFRPNNYRRQTRVSIRSNSATEKIKRTIAKLPGTSIKEAAHSKLLFIYGWRNNITIQYGKEHLTAIWSQNVIGGHKETFFFQADNVQDLQNLLDRRKSDIQERIDEALSSFCKTFKLLSFSAEPEWVRHEDFIKGEEYIDKLPAEVIIHNTVFKKVYGGGIEGIGGKGQEPVIKIKNYIKNRMLEDVAPEISEALEKMPGAMLEYFSPFFQAIEKLTAEIELHRKVETQQLRTMEAMEKYFNEERSLSKKWGW